MLTQNDPLDLYRMMVRIRTFEETVRDVVHDGSIPGSSHLSIGQEAIAAGVCSVLDDRDRVVSNYRGHGHCLACGGDPKPMMAEVFGKEAGYGGGRLGSLHLSAPELGMLGANAIVGAGSPIAVGSAFAQQYRGTGGVTVVFFGDGASDRGTQHEAMNLAALWKLPVVFVVENNGVAYFTPQDKHQKIIDISTRAQAYGFRGETVDGNDVTAVREATTRAVGECRKGLGPVLLEFKTYRYEGHFVGDACEYRTEEEVERWKAERDPLDHARDELLAAGHTTSELDAIAEEARAEMLAAVDFAREAPFPVPEAETVDAPANDIPAPVGPMQRVSFSKAVRQAITAELEADDTLFCAGEDITWGGTMKLYYGLAKRFPERILDTPISETAFTGLAVGAAAMGLRPLVDFNIMDFTLVAMDEILNQVTKFTALSGGKVHLPVVLHAASGAMDGAALQHSQDLEALFCHVPGLKVVYPSNPYDAKGLMAAAINDPDPVMFLDAMELQSMKADVPEEAYEVPIGKAAVVRQGTDVTIVSYSPMMARVLEAADQLAEEGISAEVIDLRTLMPLDTGTLLASVAKTGRLVIAHQAITRGGYGAEVAAVVAERAFGDLKAPIARVGARFETVPFSPTLREAFYPNAQKVIDAVKKIMA